MNASSPTSNVPPERKSLRPVLGISLVAGVLALAGVGTYVALSATSPTSSALQAGITTLVPAKAGSGPVTIEFWANAAGGTAPYTYAWTFSDGSTATGSPTTETFPAGGNGLHATLEVTDAKGAQASSSVAIST